ncbi:hypothetical protein BKA64DRAFT_649623 [Cadophora sp. MPI-SDFR-AT-0126]|nr:hypothetical protein BKA64DRAFT_649623 [Leotiomycetes sp. MPI-SDFR-AT-0126]
MSASILRYPDTAAREVVVKEQMLISLKGKIYIERTVTSCRTFVNSFSNPKVTTYLQKPEPYKLFLKIILSAKPLLAYEIDDAQEEGINQLTATGLRTVLQVTSEEIVAISRSINTRAATGTFTSRLIWEEHQAVKAAEAVSSSLRTWLGNVLALPPRRTRQTKVHTSCLKTMKVLGVCNKALKEADEKDEAESRLLTVIVRINMVIIIPNFLMVLSVANARATNVLILAWWTNGGGHESCKSFLLGLDELVLVCVEEP